MQKFARFSSSFQGINCEYNFKCSTYTYIGDDGGIAESLVPNTDFPTIKRTDDRT